jgi:BON domain
MRCRAFALTGIVSRVGVPGGFIRSDGEIRHEVVNNVIAGKFALNPTAFDVTVTSGIVTVIGHVEGRAVATRLIEAVRSVEGVAGVRDSIITDEHDGDPPQGRTMAEIARAALDEAGRPDLASVVLGDDDRPGVDWRAMGRLPSFDDVRAVHTALRRAYDACAPGQIGEGEGQFTDNVEYWYRSVLEYLADR